MKKIAVPYLILICTTVFGQPGKPILKIESGMHSAYGLKVATDKSGNLILTCSVDNTARVWDAKNGQQLQVLRIPIDTLGKGYISACALSPDGTIGVLAGITESEKYYSSTLYVVAIQTGEILHTIQQLPDLVFDIEFSPDGNYIAAGLRGKNGVLIYHTVRWNLYKHLNGYAGSVRNLAFDFRSRLATISFDGIMRQYDNKFLLLGEEKNLCGKKPISICYNPAGTVLAIGYEDVQTIELRESGSLRLLSKPDVETSNGTLSHLSFSADGTQLAGGRYADQLVDSVKGKWVKIIRIWKNAGSGKYTDIRVFPKNIVEDIKPLPNGNWVIMGAYPHLVMIDSNGKTIWQHESGNNDYYAGVNTTHLKVSQAGSSIGFTPQFETPLTFDVSDRLLHNEPNVYPSMTDSVAGIKVTRWNDEGHPFINGRKIDFLGNNRSVDINGKSTEIVFGADGGQIFKTDSAGNILWVAKTVVGGVWAVNISGNDKTVVAALSDGTIRWFRMEDGKELLAFYVDNDKKRWVLFTPSGYYDASPGGEDFLGWHVNNGDNKAPSFFPVSRFRQLFYRPDIIDALLETYDEKSAVNLANKRKGREEVFENNLIPTNSPPIITIISPANGSTVNNAQIIIRYSITSPAPEVTKTLKVLVNGRPVSIARDISSVASESGKLEVSIPSEDCTITLLAEDNNGTSPEANLYLKWDAAEKTKPVAVIKPNLYVLAIGVSRYNKKEYTLNFAAKDAEDFSSAIVQQKGKIYNGIEIMKLTDIEATKVNVLNGLQWIQEKTTRNDIAMIFFAGHGLNDNSGIYYMLPVDADAKYLRSTCINFEEIKQTQSTIQGKVIVFIDACHSGNIAGASGNYINGLINLLTSTVKGAGAITITSSTGKETSLEDETWGNGAFTKALIEGLNGAAATEEEKEITYTSLSLYISRRVKKITSDRQHPTLVPTPNTPDFVIALRH